jgi:hypothetical protein
MLNYVFVFLPANLGFNFGMSHNFDFWFKFLSSE